MIVFSATNEKTGEVFVGSARESLEGEWAQLISQADEGAEGHFFDLLRRHGPDRFDVEEWAYAETPAELRELTREARAELGAEPIKNARSRSGAGIGRSKNSLTMEAIMASIEEAAQEVDQQLKTLEQRERQRTDSPSWSSDKVNSGTMRSATGQPRHSTPSPTDASAPIATGKTGSSSKERRIREAIAAEREEREQLRQTQSRASQAEMNSIIAQIEQRRQQGKKSGGSKSAGTKSTLKSRGASTKPAVKDPVASSPKKSASASKPDKLATGRTGSSTKEKRIREAIEQEKAEREARQRSQAAAEADEMAAILARLDERGKQAEKAKRRR